MENWKTMEKKIKTKSGDVSPSSVSMHSKPSMPPPPYFTTHFINPNSFKGAINTKTDKPIMSLFRLSVRILQFAFAMASGISYGIELHHRWSAETTNFIYAEVVFGLTLITLIFESITVRYYRFVWIFEYTLAVLWITCFGLFYNTYLTGEVDPAYAVVDLGLMKRAVWCDLINAGLWQASAIFSTAMCCSGIKAAIRGKLEERRQKKVDKKLVQRIGQMETGTVEAK